MAMTPEQIRLAQNPVLTGLLLGMTQGDLIAETLFPRLPTALRGFTLGKIGYEHMQQYNLRRAPGSATKRIEINYEGVTYTVKQYSVEVPLPRELIQESEAMRRMNVGTNLNVSQIAMTTAAAVLALGYEIEAATLAADPTLYPSGNTAALTGSAKWSDEDGKPVSDILEAAEVIRGKTGRRPNTLLLSPGAFAAVRTNPEVRSYLSMTQLGPATLDQLKTIFNVASIVIGDAVWKDGKAASHDVWGNNALLAYVPSSFGGNQNNINLAEPAFGFTSVLEGNPFAEQPYYEDPSKSWIFGATFERECVVATPEAGFLFQTPV
ncbi:MAG: major capsid protein [Zoogloeaceae bacterium]|jgi:hypothetical protein|nr:major capsid protein [Zoogloeaceae bacterium]